MGDHRWIQSENPYLIGKDRCTSTDTPITGADYNDVLVIRGPRKGVRDF